MRILTLLVLLFLPLTTAVARAETSVRVPWLEDVPWSDVLSRAQNDPQRPILIDFYAQWCRPCKLLDVMVYNEAEVIQELSTVVTFKVDIDKPEYRALKEQFHIQVVPTLVWLDERGRELDRFTGYQNRDEFLALVRTIRSGGDTFYQVIDRQAARPENPGLLFDLARRYSERGDWQRAEILYRRLMNLRFRADKSVVVDGMLGLAAMQERAGRKDRARNLARRAADVFTAGDSTVQASLMAVAEFQGSLPDTAGVLRTYGRLIAFDDTDPVALAAYVRVATAAGRDLEQATKYGLRAVIMSDSNPRVMADLARCYARRKYFLKAKRWMEKARRKDPKNQHYDADRKRYEEEMRQSPFRYRGRRR